MRYQNFRHAIYAAVSAAVFVGAGTVFAQQPTLQPVQQPGAQPVQAPAAKAGGASIGVVDIQRLFRESTAGKSANQGLANLRAEYQTSVARIEEKLRVEEAELNRSRAANVTPEQFETARRALQQRVQDSQRQVQERNNALDNAQAAVRDEILKNIQELVVAEMNARGYTIVLDQAQVLLSHDSLNMTAEVLRRLDQKLPTIKVPVPNLTSAPAAAPAAPPVRR